MIEDLHGYDAPLGAPGKSGVVLNETCFVLGFLLSLFSIFTAKSRPRSQKSTSRQPIPRPRKSKQTRRESSGDDDEGLAFLPCPFSAQHFLPSRNSFFSGRPHEGRKRWRKVSVLCFCKDSRLCQRPSDSTEMRDGVEHKSPDLGTLTCSKYASEMKWSFPPLFQGWNLRFLEAIFLAYSHRTVRYGRC